MTSYRSGLDKGDVSRAGSSRLRCCDGGLFGENSDPIKVAVEEHRSKNDPRPRVVIADWSLGKEVPCRIKDGLLIGVGGGVGLRRGEEGERELKEKSRGKIGGGRDGGRGGEGRRWGRR